MCEREFKWICSIFYIIFDFISHSIMCIEYRLKSFFARKLTSTSNMFMLCARYMRKDNKEGGILKMLKM